VREGLEGLATDGKGREEERPPSASSAEEDFSAIGKV
jgi:hypothetical protein